jgi:hypothetical protein
LIGLASVFPLFSAAPRVASGHMSPHPVPRFIVANPAALCHKRRFIARLIKGCRVDVRTDYFISEII